MMQSDTPEPEFLLDVAVGREGWTGEFAWLREIGVRSAVVLRTRGGWFMVCASCEVERCTIGGTFGQWEADAHNETPAHRLAVAL